MEMNFLNELQSFLEETNDDLLTTFAEFQASMNNTEASKTQKLITNTHNNVNTHTNRSHANNHSNWGGENSHNNNAPHGNHGNHANGEYYSWGCGAFSCTSISWNGHANSGGHGNWSGSHTNSHSNRAHSNHTNTTQWAANTHQNVNTGFNHSNYVPSQPQLFEVPTYLKGSVTLQMNSYDKDASTIYYKVEVQKSGTTTWYTLKDDTNQSFVWNTLNPLASGMDMNGAFTIRVTPYNKVNNNSVVQTGTALVQAVTLKQNTSPTIAVENGNQFINFTFGKAVTNTAKNSISYTANFGQDNLLITANIYDADADNYIKAYVEILDGTTVVATKQVVWAANGSEVISSGNTTRKGYVTFTKDELKNIAGTSTVKTYKVRIKAQDYMDAACTKTCDSIVTQTLDTGKEMSFALDFVAPILSITRPTAWTGANTVNLVISASDFALDYVLAPNGSKLQNGSNYAVNQNGSYVFTAYDKAGNTTQQTVVVDKFDKEAPQLDLTMKIYPIANMDTWKNNITMMLSASDNVSGLAKVTVNGVTVSNTNYEFKVRAGDVTTIETTDNVGNTAKTVLHFFNSSNGETAYVPNKANESAGVDQAAPEHHISIDVGNTNHMGDWMKSLPFAVSSIDYNGKVTNFKFAGSTITTGLASVAKATLETGYLAESKDGNLYTSKASIKFINMDKTAPTLAIEGFQDSVYSQEVDLTFKKSDTGANASGADFVMITLPNGNKVKSYLDKYAVVENGTYKFDLYDFAGNKSSTQTLVFTKIDRIKPTVQPVQLNKDGWVGKAEIAFTTNDNLSGVSQVFVRKAGETTKYPFAPNAKYTTKENGTYYVSAVDSAGNISNEVPINITNVDMIAPTVTVEYVSPASNKYVDSVDILITGNDSESGIKSIHLPTGQVIFKDTYTHTVTENGSYSYYVTDNAGNKSEVNSIPVTNIDTSGVTVSHVKTYNPETQKVSIAFTMTDEESGVTRLISSNETIELSGKTTETATVEVSSNGTYTFQIVNAVNKITNYRVTVNECPGAGIDTFQVVGVTDESGTGSMLVEGSTLPSTSVGVYKNAVVTVQAITINTPDDVVFSVSGASSAYVLDNVHTDKGANSNEWNLSFTVSDMSVSEAVVEIQAQAVTGSVYSKSKSVFVKITRDADGQPIANIIG